MRLDRIAPRLGRPLILRQPRLQRDDPRRAGIGIVEPRKCQDLRDIIVIGLADRVIFRARQQVIIARRQPQPRLACRRGIAGRIILVGGDAQIDRRRIARRHHQPHQRSAILHAVDRRQIGGERGGAPRLDAGLVHPRGIEIADLLRGRIAWMRGLLLDDRTNLLLDLVRQVVIIARAHLVGGDRVRLQPMPLDIIEEIVARLDLAIHVLGRDSPAAVSRRIAWRGRHQERRDGDGN